MNTRNGGGNFRLAFSLRKRAPGRLQPASNALVQSWLMLQNINAPGHSSNGHSCVWPLTNNIAALITPCASLEITLLFFRLPLNQLLGSEVFKLMSKVTAFECRMWELMLEMRPLSLICPIRSTYVRSSIRAESLDSHVPPCMAWAMAITAVWSSR